MTAHGPRQVPFDEACRFITKLGTAAHAYGSTAAWLEAFLSRVTAVFGYRGVFRSTPREIIFAFQESDDQLQQIQLQPLPGTGLDLNKLASVGELVDQVIAGHLAPNVASARLDEIATKPAPWGCLASGVSYATVGAGLAALLSGSWWDVALATPLSLLVYGIVLLSGRLGERAVDWLPLSSAFVAATLATALKAAVPELNIVLVTLAAVAVLLPGYTISLGVGELVSGYVVSGITNLVSGLVYLVKQIAGAWIGVGLMSALVGVPAAAAAPIDRSWLWFFAPLLIVGLCVVFQTSRRDLLWASLGCVVAYAGILGGSALAGPNLGNLLGTILVVGYVNLWGARTRRPTSIVLLPAIVFLVSGSIGFRGLAAIAEGHVAVGAQQFFQMFVVALTITAGLLVGKTVFRSKVAL